MAHIPKPSRHVGKPETQLRVLADPLWEIGGRVLGRGGRSRSARIEPDQETQRPDSSMRRSRHRSDPRTRARTSTPALLLSQRSRESPDSSCRCWKVIHRSWVTR